LFAGSVIGRSGEQSAACARTIEDLVFDELFARLFIIEDVDRPASLHESEVLLCGLEINLSGSGL
jgi:hypothetical protein